jgi:chromosome segregation ATPase
MSKEPTKPSDSLVQQLLTERRELKIAVERLKLDLADAEAAGGGRDPKGSRELGELKDELERLRYQLASARAEANNLRDERDHLKSGIEKALAQLSADDED